MENPCEARKIKASQNLHKEISTHHLTVLTTSVIVSIEHENSVFYEKQVTGNDFMMITEDTMSRRWAYEYQ